MGLANDAITAGKYDESTAFPVKKVDSGDTEIARTGADSDTLETLSDQMDALGGGAGAISFTYTLTDSITGNPVGDADIWASTDLAGTNVVASGRTDQFGKVTFQLDAGNIYIWAQKSGLNPDDFPDLEVVA